MAAARTLAMGFNRIADRWIDAHNPRTAHRPLVTGTIPLRTAWIGIAIAAMVLAFAAWRLGPLPLKLLPFAYLFLLGYSFTKRFTWMTHFILGFTDSLAPAGAWAAIRGSLFTPADLPAWILVTIVTLWIGGFDLIYACQDIECDRRDHLQSIPARFGASAALNISVLCHASTIFLLAALGIIMKLSWPFWIGCAVTAMLLTWEHRLVKPNDLSKINVAFFNINSYISVTLFLSILAALIL
jgi:4-hydroxybenzoate polyprenyltransferase